MKKWIALMMMMGLNMHAAAVAGVAEGVAAGVAAYNATNYALALKNISPSAEAGNADAQHLLGLMYYMGRGVRRDYAQAFAWQYKAAAQGLPAAQYLVGAMYYEGNGVPRNAALAVSWFRKAADQGHPDAQYALGLMYRYHVAGLPGDSVIAYMLWHLAAARGHRDAGSQRADLARQLTEKQIAEAECLAREWHPGQPLPARSHSGGGAS